jgi:hypothetical protein
MEERWGLRQGRTQGPVEGEGRGPRDRRVGVEKRKWVDTSRQKGIWKKTKYARELGFFSNMWRERGVTGVIGERMVERDGEVVCGGQ